MQSIYPNAKYKNTSMIYLLAFNYTVADLFLQFAENLKGYKIFPFEKEIIVICNLSVEDVRNILLNTRFQNNPFYYNLIQDIYENMYPDMFEEFIKDDEFHILDENLFVRDKQELTDDDEVPLPKENDDMSAEYIKIISYDNAEEIKHIIIGMYPKLAPYLTDDDMYDICKVTIQIECNNSEWDSMYMPQTLSILDHYAFVYFEIITVTLSYRQLIYNSIKLNGLKEDDEYVRWLKERFFEIGYLIGEKLPKIKELMASDHIKKPDMLETQNYDEVSIKDEDVDEVLNTELIDSSEVPQENILKGVD